MNDMIVIYNKEAEQFLFMHGIDYAKFERDEFGAARWLYTKSDETNRVLEEFKAVLKKRTTKSKYKFGA